MKHYFLVLFLLIGSILFSQEHTINGTIKDSGNGETLLGATVYLEGTQFGAITNEYGFSL